MQLYWSGLMEIYLEWTKFKWNESDKKQALVKGRGNKL